MNKKFFISNMLDNIGYAIMYAGLAISFAAMLALMFVMIVMVAHGFMHA